MQLKPNQLIDDRYQVIENLDKLGRGSVWKSLDTQQNSNVVIKLFENELGNAFSCLLYTSPSPRDATLSRMPSSA